MTLVQPGDVVFSGLDNAVRAVSMASAAAYDADWPDPRDEKNWGREGWRLDVIFSDLPRPIPYSEWVDQVRSQLTYRNSPFDITGEANQGFLYSLPDPVGELLLSMANVAGIDVAVEAARQATFSQSETQKEAVIYARIGQGQFRKSLIEAWRGKCPLSGVDRPELLRASHIKPWASCNNSERLDPANGLLLSVSYDAAFDARLITFDTVGRLVLAPDFPADAAEAAGINAGAALSQLPPGSEKYLAAHRDLLDARVARQRATGGGSTSSTIRHKTGLASAPRF